MTFNLSESTGSPFKHLRFCTDVLQAEVQCCHAREIGTNSGLHVFEPGTNEFRINGKLTKMRTCTHTHGIYDADLY